VKDDHRDSTFPMSQKPVGQPHDTRLTLDLDALWAAIDSLE